MSRPTVAEALSNVFGTTPESKRPSLAHEERIRKALEKGERDAALLDGRDFDRRYWTNAKAALGNLVRQRDNAERERDAFRATLEALDE